MGDALFVVADGLITRRSPVQKGQCHLATREPVGASRSRYGLKGCTLTTTPPERINEDREPSSQPVTGSKQQIGWIVAGSLVTGQLSVSF
jgi:hypothetical protein